MKGAAASLLLPAAIKAVAQQPRSRVHPGDAAWPSPESWQRLGQEVGGRLVSVRSPLDACRREPNGASCSELFRLLSNPYYIGDEVSLTQTSGWVDAWSSAPSAYAVAAATTRDVVAAVNFARERNLRLVIKGGGHSYQGTSNAADSLLIWTRAMNGVALHEQFVAQGCSGVQDPQPAVTLGSGAMWQAAYEAVTTRGGRYVQGGGCVTVGVAGLIQSGGFGSFSKNFGLAAAGLVEAEVVTADGEVRIANACSNPELFWGLKGGGGGSLGVVTRLTLKTRALPATFGVAFGKIKATSDAAYRRLIARVMVFYRDVLLPGRWGEQLIFQPDNALRVSMVCADLDQDQAQQMWRPFLDWIAASPLDFTLDRPVMIANLPARRAWDAEYLNKSYPGVMRTDDRPGAPAGNVYWADDAEQVGQVIHGYRSAWLPARLLRDDRQQSLADALFASSRHRGVSLHFNKGLAGAPAEDLAAASDTAMNPAVLDSFALAIIGAIGDPAFQGVAGHEPDVAAARRRAGAVRRAMDELLKVAPGAGSYVAESDYFERDWQRSFWGANYPRLAAVKRKYDPAGLFFVHHGVGSEEWIEDGFTRLRP